MIIRKATIDDLAIIAGFQTKMAAETEGVSLDSVLLRKGLTALLTDSSKGQYYVADIDGALAGCLMTTFEWSEWRNGTVLWIQSVYVVQAHRKQGVYKKMYEHIQHLVEADSSLKGIRLYADITNDKAKDVYTRLGMNGEHYQVFEWIKS